MKIARKAFGHPYDSIDPREVPIDDIAKRIDYEYVPVLWIFFFLGAVSACAVLILLAIIFI